MKKILLLIIVLLIVIFVGKYVYDKQGSKGSVTLGESNTANVSVSKDQTLTVEKGKRGDIVRYIGTMKVVNSTKQASSSFTFLNMPVLYKLNPGTGQYAVATSVIPVGNIKDDRGQQYPLMGPVFVIGVGALRQFTVDASWSDLSSGTYKASLGTSGNWSGYSINGGALQLLPSMQTNVVKVKREAPANK